ncbi:hypothetical protein [Arsenicibacter rosenii]|uniref:Uncharacterized protein n=1 Tax=Arsenicibacter rosenii TaxID=1750698 RepID=A0A1S2VBE2_9BACT|nr:hypothetical protein [Arsenicibacter rosenii]OIN55740.1 hypothetical protein BLX24_28405 [Arsenicibacter rosenii]
MKNLLLIAAICLLFGATGKPREVFVTTVGYRGNQDEVRALILRKYKEGFVLKTSISGCTSSGGWVCSATLVFER